MLDKSQIEKEIEWLKKIRDRCESYEVCRKAYIDGRIAAYQHVLSERD